MHVNRYSHSLQPTLQCKYETIVNLEYFLFWYRHAHYIFISRLLLSLLFCNSVALSWQHKWLVFFVQRWQELFQLKKSDTVPAFFPLFFLSFFFFFSRVSCYLNEKDIYWLNLLCSAVKLTAFSSAMRRLSVIWMWCLFPVTAKNNASVQADIRGIELLCVWPLIAVHNRSVHHKCSTNSLFGCIAQVKTAVYITRMCKSEGREFRGEKVIARLAILYQCLQRSYLPYANGISPIPAPASESASSFAQ